MVVQNLRKRRQNSCYLRTALLESNKWFYFFIVFSYKIEESWINFSCGTCSTPHEKWKIRQTYWHGKLSVLCIGNWVPRCWSSRAFGKCSCGQQEKTDHPSAHNVGHQNRFWAASLMQRRYDLYGRSSSIHPSGFIAQKHIKTYIRKDRQRRQLNTNRNLRCLKHLKCCPIFFKNKTSVLFQ